MTDDAARVSIIRIRLLNDNDDITTANIIDANLFGLQIAFGLTLYTDIYFDHRLLCIFAIIKAEL